MTVRGCAPPSTCGPPDGVAAAIPGKTPIAALASVFRSEEHTSELQSPC